MEMEGAFDFVPNGVLSMVTCHQIMGKQLFLKIDGPVSWLEWLFEEIFPLESDGFNNQLCESTGRYAHWKNRTRLGIRRTHNSSHVPCRFYICAMVKVVAFCWGMGNLPPSMIGILISWGPINPYGLGLMSLSPIIWEIMGVDRPWHIY